MAIPDYFFVLASLVSLLSLRQAQTHTSGKPLFSKMRLIILKAENYSQSVCPWQRWLIWENKL